MFGFIKNWIKPKNFKEVKKEYKAVEIERYILHSCTVGLRHDLEECPSLIIYNYKRLLEIADEEALLRATNYIFVNLSEQQQQDFRNKVSQLKEYKEWIEKQRLNKLNEDF